MVEAPGGLDMQCCSSIRGSMPTLPSVLMVSARMGFNGSSRSLNCCSVSFLTPDCSETRTGILPFQLQRGHCLAEDRAHRPLRFQNLLNMATSGPSRTSPASIAATAASALQTAYAPRVTIRPIC